LFAEVCSQRFQNQLKKIVDRTAFHVDQLALAHDRLAAPANRLPAPAKDVAQSVCKNSISAIVLPASLPRFLKGNDGGACCLRDIHVGRLFDFSRKGRNLVSPNVSPMRPWGLVVALIVARNCPLDWCRKLASEEQAGIFRNCQG
jgi:hypothetical protein